MSVATIDHLSERTLELLESLPPPGSRHAWLLSVAGRLVRALSKEECFDYLCACRDMFEAPEEVPDREIQSVVDFAYGAHAQGSGQRTPKWPAPDRMQIDAVLRSTPARIGPTATGDRPADVLCCLFLPGELTCTGPRRDKARVCPLETTVQNADQMQFIVPNRMKAVFGLNKQGKKSHRCQANVAERRHLVAEFDDPALTKGMQSQLATWLSRYAPLVLVVDSGNKSLHAWYRVDHMSPREQARFFALACLVGADPSRWDICGWVRMPGGTRRHDNGSETPQEILYFNVNGVGSLK